MHVTGSVLALPLAPTLFGVPAEPPWYTLVLVAVPAAPGPTVVIGEPLLPPLAGFTEVPPPTPEPAPAFGPSDGFEDPPPQANSRVLAIEIEISATLHDSCSCMFEKPPKWFAALWNNRPRLSTSNDSERGSAPVTRAASRRSWPSFQGSNAR